MIQKHTLIGILLAAVLLGMVPAFGVAAPGLSWSSQEGTNLVQNPGFEGITCRPDSPSGQCLDNWTHDVHDGTFHDNIFTPQGWVTWWRTGGNYRQPEVQVIPNVHPYTGELPRIRSGYYSLKYFNFYGLQDGGLYQVVNGLEPGATVQFSAYGHGWSCNSDEKMGYSCDDPWNQWFQVGIEPNGVADPFSPGVIWGPEQLAPDHYTLIGPVTAQVGAGGSVCVIVRSQTKWGFKYQDAYWDDTSLVVTSPGVPPTSTPLPPPPTATPGPSPTPRGTPTPRPDGATVHVVESGDTLFGIALMYGVDVDQIRELNAGSLGSNDLLSIGQELVISLPSETPTPTPLPPPPSPTPESITTTQASPTPPAGASLCVLAYHDRNGDALWDEATEELLPNAEFTVADTSGVIAQYTSDGLNEPYCFTGLAAGAYRVIQSPPPGYEPSGPAEWPVALAEGTGWDFQFGDVRSGSPAAPGETTEPTPANENNDESNGGLTFGSVFSVVAKISGVLVLILAIGVAALFVLNRRRM